MRLPKPLLEVTTAMVSVGLLLGPMNSARAQGQPNTAGGDPPLRAGRVAKIAGSVSFRTIEDTQWGPATLNYPVSAGDAFWTEPQAEADLEVSATRIALAGQTELDVANLDAQSLVATEPQGELYLHPRALANGETYTIQTPRGTVAVAAVGRYEVAAGDTQNPTTITVLDGAAQVTGANINQQVGAGQTLVISGSDTSLQAQVQPAQQDQFLAAMLASERPPSTPSVAPPPVVAQMSGGEDLSAYGTWDQTPNYGTVWYPQTDPGWVPYREGHWAYVAPWGWTWVDNAPWGFAPFHYGRWVDVDGRWGWTPGTYDVAAAPEPVYAPALVTFFALGAAAGLAAGAIAGAALAGGSIGWCPLGPHEAYVPPYHVSQNYLRQVNITHVQNINNITNITNNSTTINNYVNRGAATVVPAAAMTASRPIAPAVQHVAPTEFASARPVVGHVPVQPTVATAGVTPAVARSLHLAAPPNGQLPNRPTAPGPQVNAEQFRAGHAPTLRNAALTAHPTPPGTPPVSGVGPHQPPAGAASNLPQLRTPEMLQKRPGEPGGPPAPVLATPNAKTPPANEHGPAAPGHELPPGQLHQPQAKLTPTPTTPTPTPRPEEHRPPAPNVAHPHEANVAPQAPSPHPVHPQPPPVAHVEPHREAAPPPHQEPPHPPPPQVHAQAPGPPPHPAPPPPHIAAPAPHPAPPPPHPAPPPKKEEQH